MNRFFAIVCMLALSVSLAFAVNLYAADVTLTVVISDANNKANDVLDAFVKAHGWTADNPANRSQYAKQTIEKFIRQSATAYRATKKAEEERTKEAASVEADTVFK